MFIWLAPCLYVCVDGRPRQAFPLFLSAFCFFQLTFLCLFHLFPYFGRNISVCHFVVIIMAPYFAFLSHILHRVCYSPLFLTAGSPLVCLFQIFRFHFVFSFQLNFSFFLRVDSYCYASIFHRLFVFFRLESYCECQRSAFQLS